MHSVHLLRVLLHSVEDLLQQILQAVQFLRDCLLFDPVVQIPQMSDAFHPLCHHTVKFLLSLRLCSVLCCSFVRHLFCLLL